MFGGRDVVESSCSSRERCVWRKGCGEVIVMKQGNMCLEEGMWWSHRALAGKDVFGGRDVVMSS